MQGGKFCYDYPRPALSADCVIFAVEGDDLHVLLVRRGREPFRGKWACPGGFVNMDETVEEAASRELYEETGLKDAAIEQLHTFSAVDRDPRGRVVTVAFVALVSKDNCRPEAGDDAEKAEWFNISEIPELAFDHNRILELALERIRQKMK